MVSIRLDEIFTLLCCMLIPLFVFHFNSFFYQEILTIPVNVTTSCQDLYIDPHVSDPFAVLTINNFYYVAWFSLSASSQLRKQLL